MSAQHHMQYSLCKTDLCMRLDCSFCGDFQRIKFREVLSTSFLLSLKALPLLVCSLALGVLRKLPGLYSIFTVLKYILRYYLIDLIAFLKF